MGEMQRALALLLCVIWFPLTAGVTGNLSARKRMVREQILAKGIVDSRILDAFSRVARHLFVAPELRHRAYEDAELPIDEGQTVNRPYTVAIMTAIISPGLDKKVLEIGTGSGYQAAILAELVNRVYTIDIYKRLTRKARNRISALGYKNVFFKTGDGYQGWEEHAPYDGIIVTCSPDHIPEPLIRQLAVGGKMVIPVSFSRQVQELILVEKEPDGSLKRTNLIPVQFVPMIQRTDDN